MHDSYLSDCVQVMWLLQLPQLPLQSWIYFLSHMGFGKILQRRGVLIHISAAQYIAYGQVAENQKVTELTLFTSVALLS